MGSSFQVLPLCGVVDLFQFLDVLVRNEYTATEMAIPANAALLKLQ
jgi:hypothetical protein